MLNGFGKWQLRIALFALISLGMAAVSSIFQWWPASLMLISAAIGSLVILQIIGVRLVNRRTSAIQKSLSGLDTRLLENSRSIKKLPTSANPKTKTVTGILKTGPAEEMARRISEMPGAIETFTLQSASTSIRDAFAYAASSNELNFKELIRLLAVESIGLTTSKGLKSLNHKHMLALARILANQQACEGDVENAVRIFSFVEKTHGANSLGKTDRFIFVEALSASGNLRAVREHIKSFRIAHNFPVHAALLSLNSINQVDGVAQGGRWIETLDAFFVSAGLLGIRLSDGDGSLLDRLETVSSDGVANDSTKISVLVPTYNGSAYVKTAINSLVSQTWRNLEIIIIDDCSDPEHVDFLREVSRIDQRIKLVLSDKNQGPYCARNRGLELATGDFITVHDDDDWSHAQKLQIQVEHLLQNPSIPANLSNHSRSTEDLEFLRINNNPQFTQPNFSSLMVRRSVIESLGPWDAIGRGADAEFRDRLVNWYGDALPIVGTHPMSFTRTRANSLTSGEMKRGYVDPSRRLYLAAYTRWHQHERDAGRIATNARKGRLPFAIASNLNASGTPRGSKFDVIYATDFRFPGGTSTLTLTELEAAAKEGLKVGVIQLDSPLNKPGTPMTERFFALLARSSVELLSLSDSVECDSVVIRHPSVVQYAENLSSNIVAKNVVLIVNNPPMLTGGSGMLFDLNDCISNVDTMFSCRTRVVAESAPTLRLCRPLVAAARLESAVWPGVVALDEAPDVSAPTGTPVVGRHTRDNPLKWPSRLDDFRSAYIGGEQFRTVVLGGNESLKSKFGEKNIAGPEYLPFGTVPVSDFLRGIDFWVYFHDDALTESFGMATAEAMAAGKVVIVPPYMQGTFGEGAVYANASEVPAVIASFVSSPHLYVEQAHRARRVIEERYSASSLISRLKNLTHADEKSENTYA
ncbi:glycosyltransferase [Arthrobacter cupressi]|uniref:Glycosyl transferase family 2 n=1 Tax=Arthrobacter cupressi TaxID=1045773 RepID=A0A1G8UMJ0_9MICC|nr:glycosyltransferase [Arthrobacter cupressi]NYD76484.1 glycosyltransferase involved in cell wall biosynthesis [Arthrobacter cupressi]SDJ54375.1 Glycosyl transferase family 2 [Arthrobacter cupressi]